MKGYWVRWLESVFNLVTFCILVEQVEQAPEMVDDLGKRCSTKVKIGRTPGRTGRTSGRTRHPRTALPSTTNPARSAGRRPPTPGGRVAVYFALLPTTRAPRVHLGGLSPPPSQLFLSVVRPRVAAMPPLPRLPVPSPTRSPTTESSAS